VSDAHSQTLTKLKEN